MAGKYTRTFRNYHHSEIKDTDYNGSRTLLHERYKLVIDGEKDNGVELFDVVRDPYETTNLAEELPAITASLQDQMKNWQDSVINSLTAADY